MNKTKNVLKKGFWIRTRNAAADIDQDQAA